MTITETVTGTVEARNERGIRVAGEWRNLSKFKPLELPAVGAQVALGLDPKGFITTLEVDAPGVCTVGAPEGVRAPSASTQRDETITKLAVLKAAAEFVGLWGQTRPEVKSEHVLQIADRWLAWVEQS